LNIAIIGSGFFGIVSAIIMSKKHKVDLYEKKSQIFNGASAFNQMRYHYGFHYPRSQRTFREINKSVRDFNDFFSLQLFGKTENFYLVAKNGKTSFKKYIYFLNKNKIKFIKTRKYRNIPQIEGSIRSNEKIINYFKTKKFLKKKLINSKVNLKLNTEFKKEYLNKYDKVIIATYSNNNLILKKLGIKKIEILKFELVEKIVIKLPISLKNKSFVVIDGDFVCVDPYLGTNYHLLSDVKLSKIEIKIGKYPNFTSYKKKFLNCGLIKNKKISRFENFIKRSSKYLPFLKKSKYIGSFYVTRAIKTNREKTDERISYIKLHNNKIISILSGKWNNCVTSAKEISSLLK